MRSLSVATLLAVCSTALFAQHDQHFVPARDKGATLGTIVFPNSGNPAAQQPFLRGVALLHSFEYEAAATAFKHAQKADPGLALAYWGEALTYSHVVWRMEDIPASRRALAKLAPTAEARLAKAKTPRERAFGTAVEAFYQDGTLNQRVSAYSDSLRRLAASDTTDREAAAFAAHALMLAGYQAEGDARTKLFREAADLAQRVAAANPDHPGATHYLIHLYDSPGMAQHGLAFARAYDRIAPDAEHAIHMPSHIYLQLGMWDDVVRSNERAWAASRKPDNEGGPDWHAFAWLQYGYLQQGRNAEARGLIDTARALFGSAGAYDVDASFVLPRLEFQYAVETDTWEKAISAPKAVSGGPMSERERAFRLFATYWRAVDAAQRGDPALATLAAPFLAIADSVRAGLPRSAVQASNALVVSALVQRSRGDTAGALKTLREAAAKEKGFGPFVGPPERVFAAELWATEALRGAAGADAELVAALENVLRIAPNRSRTTTLLQEVKTRLR